jgi:hypothetical protein
VGTASAEPAVGVECAEPGPRGLPFRCGAQCEWLIAEFHREQGLDPRPLRKGTSRFDNRITAVILKRVAKGDRLLRICAEPGMPSVQTIYKWMKKDADFRHRIEQARSNGESFA